MHLIASPQQLDFITLFHKLVVLQPIEQPFQRASKPYTRNQTIHL